MFGRHSRDISILLSGCLEPNIIIIASILIIFVIISNVTIYITLYLVYLRKFTKRLFNAVTLIHYLPN